MTSHNTIHRISRPRSLARLACLAGLSLAVGLAGGGCNVDDSSTRRNEPIRRDEPRSDSNYPTREPEVIRIPRDARLADSGSGNLRYTAPSDGRVWVRDAEETDVIIYTAKIYRGDEILVEPAGNKISINGRKVVDQDLKKNHKHQLYFDRAEYGGRYGDRHDNDYDDRPRDRDRN